MGLKKVERRNMVKRKARREAKKMKIKMENPMVLGVRYLKTKTILIVYTIVK